jgi:hypothetical protein
MRYIECKDFLDAQYILKRLEKDQRDAYQVTEYLMSLRRFLDTLMPDYED